jgi:hypothetical protein
MLNRRFTAQATATLSASIAQEIAANYGLYAAVTHTRPIQVVFADIRHRIQRNRKTAEASAAQVVCPYFCDPTHQRIGTQAATAFGAAIAQKFSPNNFPDASVAHTGPTCMVVAVLRYGV